MPNMDVLSDGRIIAGARVQEWADHEPVGDWRAFISEDEGSTWKDTEDDTIPYNWPGTTPREKLERMEKILPNGDYICAGSVGPETWPAERREEARELGLKIHENAISNNMITVGGYKLFVQRSSDKGKTWTRKEWEVPGASIVSGNRPPAFLQDGTFLYHLYTTDSAIESTHAHGRRDYVWRSTDHGDNWRLHQMGIQPPGLHTNETGMVEVSPGRVLALSRVEDSPQYLVERWSEDAGVTWTAPLRTGIWGFPAHLLKLCDGRILCSYGYRRQPGGVRAVLSEDEGRTWNLDDVIVLRQDGGYLSKLREVDPRLVPSEESSTFKTRWRSDVGYPVSVQLPDESILTAYYLTESDGVTHTAVTRWQA